MGIIRLLNSLRIRIREVLNPLFAKGRRRRIKDLSFTLISNNCWGGHVYRYFGVPYTSPTVGLFFMAEDYVRFCSDLKYYLSLPLSFIPISQSKYANKNKRGQDLKCPIGLLGDVEIVFLHYQTADEAKEKWERRKARIVWDNLYFKFSEMNQCTPALLQQFAELPYHNKLIFTTRDYGLPNQIVFNEYRNKGEIENDTLNFRRYVNLVRWINGSLFE